ncbi:hypothetical protein [Paracoccus endophyticus]|uniref:hypothetical protein n=1 Tax=Paracoccus endophyticus TaxID=2233774 RepID=UPI001F0CBF1B|nr:hypothetical protein [Paracoccus endophyticus]
MARQTRTPPDDKKITIDPGHVTLRRNGPLVQGGFYARQSDSVRTALPNHSAADSDAVARLVERRAPDRGRRDVTRVKPEGRGPHPASEGRGAGPRHDRTDHPPRRAAGACRGQGGPKGPHPLTPQPKGS